MRIALHSIALQECCVVLLSVFLAGGFVRFGFDLFCLLRFLFCCRLFRFVVVVVVAS